MALNPHGLPGIAATAGDRAVKHPGVTALQRAFFAGLESNDFHLDIVSPRAAFGVTPQGAMRVARLSRFHRILE